MNDTRSSSSDELSRDPSSQSVHFTYGQNVGDDIDVFRVVAGLWARKQMILVVTAVFAIAGGSYATLATPIYRAEVVLASAQEESSSNLSANFGGLASLAGINLGIQGSSTKALATLRSRAFVESFIIDNQLLQVLFAAQWDDQEKRWRTDVLEESPDIRDAVRFFVNNVRSISENVDTGLITLSIEWTDPEDAATWARRLVDRINNQMRSRDMDDARRRLEYLESQLQSVNLVELRQAISRLIEGEIQTIMLAQARVEYAFTVIDPSRVPDRPTRPRKMLIVVLATFFGVFFGLFCALVMNAVRDRQQGSAMAA